MLSMLRVLVLARGAASVQGLQAGGDLVTAALPADTAHRTDELQSLHLVIPCYNEADRLPEEAYVDYATAHPDTQFTFVNDGTDRTLELLEALAKRIPGQLHVLSLARNRGKAEATRYGLQVVATAEHRSTLVGFWDADLATPLEAVSDFAATLAEREQIEMVFGARVALLGRQINRLPSRHYLGRIFATLASTVLSLQIYDTQCGAKIFRNSANFRSAIAEPFDSPWIFDVELLARFIALRRGAPGVVAGDPDSCWQAGTCPQAGLPISERIFEYPLMEWTDIAGSKIKFGAKLRSLWELWNIWYRYMSPWASYPGERADSSDGRSKPEL